jgi:hypothetical protein
VGSIDQALIDAILEHQIDLLRFEEGVRARVLAVLNRLQAELAQTLTRADLTAFTKARTEALLRQATAVIDHYYATGQGVLNTAMTGAAQTTARATAQTLGPSLNIVTTVGLPTETFLARIASNALLLGSPAADWWLRQSQDTAWRFSTAVRQGLAAGETNEAIVRRVVGSPRLGIPGVMTAARSNARSLVHTSIQAAANGARMETFRKNADVLVGVRWLATLDVHTCEICAPRDRKEYTLTDDPPEPKGHVLAWDGGPGVIHWGCRCVAVPVTKTYKELGLNIKKAPRGMRASSDGPVPANMDFEAFLKRKGKAWQDEALGPGRADLWRANKLTLEQLLGDLSGTRIMTVAQLQARYA